jgi:membrane protease YdiL (CAAX protease family)
MNRAAGAKERTDTMPAQPVAVALQRFDVPWRVRDALLVILLTYLLLAGLFLGAGLVLAGGALLLGVPLPEGGWVAHVLRAAALSDEMLLVQSAVMAACAWACVLRRWSVPPGAFLAPGQAAFDVRYALRMLLWCALISAGLVIGIAGVLAGVAVLTRQDPALAVRMYEEGLAQENELILPATMSWLRLVDVIVIGPPVEELVYRGCLYAALRKRSGPWLANLASSAVFALGHHYVFGLPNVLLAGALYALAYERTRSLRAPIVFHMLWNTLSVATAAPWLWAVLGAACAGLWGWARRAVRPAGAQPTGALPPAAVRADRRTGWKVYAWGLIALSLVGYLTNLAEAWEALVELPAYLGVLAYAYRRAWLSRDWWRLYGLFYLVWIVTQCAELVQPGAFAAAFEQALAEEVPPALMLGAEAAAVGVVVVMLLPSVIALWRLASRDPA